MKNRFLKWVHLENGIFHTHPTFFWNGAFQKSKLKKNWYFYETILSVSQDGFLCTWDIVDKLDFPSKVVKLERNTHIPFDFSCFARIEEGSIFRKDNSNIIQISNDNFIYYFSINHNIFETVPVELFEREKWNKNSIRFLQTLPKPKAMDLITHFQSSSLHENINMGITQIT